MGRPATGQTPAHTVRIPDHAWKPAEERVGKGRMADLITRLLERENALAARKAKKEAERAAVDG